MKTQPESPATAQHTPSYMAQTLIALASHYKGDTSLTLLHAANAVDSHAELLAALENLADLSEGRELFPLAVKSARAAIAKAKGVQS